MLLLILTLAPEGFRLNPPVVIIIALSAKIRPTRAEVGPGATNGGRRGLDINHGSFFSEPINRSCCSFFLFLVPLLAKALLPPPPPLLRAHTPERNISSEKIPPGQPTIAASAFRLHSIKGGMRVSPHRDYYASETFAVQ